MLMANKIPKTIDYFGEMGFLRSRVMRDLNWPKMAQHKPLNQTIRFACVNLCCTGVPSGLNYTLDS